MLGHREEDSRSFSSAHLEPVLSWTQPGAAGIKQGSTNHEEQLRGNREELEYLILLKYRMVLYILRKLEDSFDSLLFFLVKFLTV